MWLPLSTLSIHPRTLTFSPHLSADASHQLVQKTGGPMFWTDRILGIPIRKEAWVMAQHSLSAS